MEHKAALEIDRPDRDDGHDNPLSRTRARGVRLISTAFWVLAIGFALIVGNAYLAATERWLRLLESARRPLGFSTPAGPDWYLIVGLGLAAVVPAAGPTAPSVSRVCASPSARGGTALRSSGQLRTPHRTFVSASRGTRLIGTCSGHGAPQQYPHLHTPATLRNGSH